MSVSGHLVCDMEYVRCPDGTFEFYFCRCRTYMLFCRFRTLCYFVDVVRICYFVDFVRICYFDIFQFQNK